MSSSSGISAAIPSVHSRGGNGLLNSEFLFDFPKFGDLPGSYLLNGQINKNDQSRHTDNLPRAPGVLTRDNLDSSTNNLSPRKVGSTTFSGSTRTGAGSSVANNIGSISSIKTPHIKKPSMPSRHDTSNSESPSSSSDSHQSQLLSSNGTSPVPSLNSPPDSKPSESNAGNSCEIHGSRNGEASFCAKLGMACGNINNPIPAVRNQNDKSNSILGGQSTQSTHAPFEDYGLDLLAQQNGGQFDPFARLPTA